MAALRSAVVMAAACGVVNSAEIVDDFSGGGWQIYSPRTPGKLTAEKGRLVITDLPGGAATWGTAAQKRFEDIDLAKTPYLVVDLLAVTSRFEIKLTSPRKDWGKTSGLNASAPGLYVIDMNKVTNWKGVGPIVVTLYASGTESTVEIGFVKFTGKLSPKEEEALNRKPKPVSDAPEFAGLIALSARQGTPPDGLDAADGERVVYRDPLTGHPVWRMTNHPAIERHEYYDIPAWNANGQLLLFLSRRPGGNGWWLMDADGSDIRPLVEPSDGGPIEAPRWSLSDPHRVYFARSDEKETRVLAMDVRDGSLTTVVSVPVPQQFEDKHFSGLEPPHPDERHFLLRWGGMDKLHTLLVVADAKTGEYKKIDAGLPTHRVRFTKHPGTSIFVNSATDPDKPGVRSPTSWVIAPDGSKTRLTPHGGHPDWSPDGEWLGVFTEGGIWLVSHDGQTRKRLVQTMADGHGGFSITTGRHHVADANNKGPYANMVYVTELATGELTPICYHGASYQPWSSGIPDPEATHPAPICSPDETKIVYDSDILGQPDVWVAVWKRPGAPRQVRFDDGRLSWQPPELHREVAGYNVYRQENDVWKSVEEMVTETDMTGLPAGRYAVAAQEWSGLESGYAVANNRAVVTPQLAPPAPNAPKSVSAGSTSTAISWTAVEDVPLDHYNVYASTDAACLPGRETLVGSPKQTRFTDWGLAPDTTYYYRVTAVDRQGNESLPSPVLSIKTSTAPGAVGHGVPDAENGKVAPPADVVRDDAAMGVYEGVADPADELPQEGKTEISKP